MRSPDGSPRLGRQTYAVLVALLAAGRPMYVAEIERLLPLPHKTGSAYLLRLEARGWVVGQREGPSMPNADRGVRTFYELTARGRVEASAAVRASAARATAQAARSGSVLAVLRDRCAEAADAVVDDDPRDRNGVMVGTALRDVAALLVAAAPHVEQAGELRIAGRFRALAVNCDRAADRWSVAPERRTSHDRDLAWRTLRGVVALLRELTKAS